MDGHLPQSYLSASLGTAPDPLVLDSGGGSSSEGVRTVSFPMGAHGARVTSAVLVRPIWIARNWTLLTASCLCGIAS